VTDVVRFELTEEESKRYYAWARALVKAHVDEEVEGVGITISFHLSPLGTRIEASCGSGRLVIRDEAE